MKYLNGCECAGPHQFRMSVRRLIYKERKAQLEFARTCNICEHKVLEEIPMANKCFELQSNVVTVNGVTETALRVSTKDSTLAANG